MRPIFTLAGLTIQEALRRRIYIGGFCIVLLFLGLMFLPGFASHRGRSGISLDPPLQAAILSYFGLGMVKFFSGVMGITLASGAIAEELERGTLYVILSKPLTRVHILLGKWLGLVALTAVNVCVWGAVLWFAVNVRERGAHWGLIRGMGLALLYPAVFVTLTLCFSTFASGMLATALAVVCIGVGWQEGFLLDLGRVFDVRILRQFSVFAGYLVPIGRIHRWMLQIAGLSYLVTDGIIPTGPGSRELHSGPFDLLYVGGYILTLLLLGLFLFQRRDV